MQRKESIDVTPGVRKPAWDKWTENVHAVGQAHYTIEDTIRRPHIDLNIGMGFFLPVV
ncbi:hypothetical protein JCM12294_04740 [Desulfocicer niacini]